MSVPNFETLEEAKQFLRENWEKGADCPCCTQFVKLYKRPMHVTMALMLIRLYHLGEGYHHVKQIAKGISDTGTNDFSKLRYWDMIEEEPNDTDKRTSGNWRITDRGREFVEGELTVPAKVRIYKKKCLGLVGEQVNIKDVIGVKFDYNELMGR